MPPKSQLYLEARPTYLYVALTGAYDLAEAQAHAREFLAAGADQRLYHFLVDALGLAGRPSVSERYTYAEFVAKEVSALTVAGRLKRPRLAYVMKPPLADNLLFGLTVAINRGLDITVTPDIEKAVRWLDGPERAR